MPEEYDKNLIFTSEKEASEFSDILQKKYFDEREQLIFKLQKQKKNMRKIFNLNELNLNEEKN